MLVIDKEALSEIKAHHYKFIKRDFLKSEVSDFLMLIREHLPKTSVLLEICHFFAHRTRDKASTHAFALENYIALEDKITVNEYEISYDGVLASNYLFSIYELQTELNCFLKKLNLDELNNDVINEIAILIMSRLNNIRFLMNPKDTNQIGEFEIKIYDSKLLLCLKTKHPVCKNNNGALIVAEHTSGALHFTQEINGEHIISKQVMEAQHDKLTKKIRIRDNDGSVYSLDVVGETLLGKTQNESFKEFCIQNMEEFILLRDENSNLNIEIFCSRNNFKKIIW